MAEYIQCNRNYTKPREACRKVRVSSDCLDRRYAQIRYCDIVDIIISTPEPQITHASHSLGQREPDMRNRFQLPEHLSLANFTTEGGQHAYGVASKGAGHSGLAEYVTSLFDPTLSWADVKWLRRTTTLPIVLKGILSPEDAVIAADLGVEAILVSNHGARQLDGVPATIGESYSIIHIFDYSSIRLFKYSSYVKTYSYIRLFTYATS